MKANSGIWVFCFLTFFISGRMNPGARDPIAFGHNQPKTENARIFEMAVKKSALYLWNNQVKLNT